MPERKASRVSTLLSTLVAWGRAIINLIAKAIPETAPKVIVTPPRKTAASPVCLVVLAPDGNSENDVSQDSPPFKLCHGAQHRLKISTPDGSTWLAQKLSLHWMGANDTPPNRYGLSAEPAFVTTTVDEEASYQVLSTAGAEWVLESTPGATVLSGDVTLGLGSYWQAPKYLLEAQVGDHWYSITELAWDGVVPIVEDGIETTLTVTLNGVFDQTRSIEGVEVVWKINGSERERTLTDEHGKSAWNYKPISEDVSPNNDIELEVSCTDGLLHNSTDRKTLLAYVTSPWPDLLRLELQEMNGAVVPSTPLGMRLVRGGNYKLFLIPTEKEKKDNFFIGKPVTLGWVEEGDSLGIVFDPEDAQTMPEQGLSWHIKGGGKSGRFTLTANAQGLSAPYLIPGVQMSGNLTEEADIEVEVDVEGAPPIFHRGVEKAVRIVPKAGSLLGLMELAATLHFDVVDEQFSSGQVPSTPAYGAPSAVVTGEGFAWTLKALNSGNSGQFGLTIKMDGFSNGLTLPKALALSDDLNDETEVFYVDNDGKDVRLGADPLVLRRDKALTLKLKPREHSGLGRTPLKGWLTFDGGTLKPEQVPADPGYGEAHKQDMTEQGLSWTLTGADVSGSMILAIHVEGFTEQVTLAKVVLLSNTLSDEAELEIELSAEGVPPIFQAGVPKDMRIVPKAGSPLALAQLAATLHFEPREDQLTAEHLKPANLAYGTPSPPLTSDGFAWTIVPNNARGEFGLRVSVSDFLTDLKMETGYLMSSHLGNDVRIYVDEEEAELGNKVLVLRRKKVHTIKMIPRDDFYSPIGRTGLKGWIEFTPGSLAKDKVIATPDYEVKRAVATGGLSWTLEGKDLSGTCALDIKVEGFATPRKIEMVRLLSEQLSDEVDVKFDNAAIMPPLVLRRKQGHKIKIVPRSGSPLAQMTDLCGISFEENGRLKEGQVPAIPPYSTRPPMSPDGLEWTLTGQEVSGTFGLNFNFPGFPPLYLGEAMLLSSNLGDEVEITFGGKTELQRPVLWRGTEAKVALRPKEGSPLSGTMTARLKFLKNDRLEESQVPADPIYNANNVKPVDSLSWTLTGPADKSGLFGLEVYAEGFTLPALWEKAIVLSTFLGHEVKVIPDRITVPIFSKGGVSIVAAENSPIYAAGLDVHVRYDRKGTDVSLRGDPPFDSRRKFDQSRAWELHWQTGMGTVGLDFHVGDGGVYSVSRYVYVGTGAEPSESWERGSHAGLRTDRDTRQGDDSLIDTAPEE